MPPLRKTVEKARGFRRALTPPEVRLWALLKVRPGGFKFRRQHPFGSYMLDFYCAAAKLAIEADGAAHDMGDSPERDLARDIRLAEGGVRTLRIPAKNVIRDIDLVSEAIVFECSV